MKFINSAYAVDTLFFLKNTESVINLLEILAFFIYFRSQTKQIKM